MVAANIPPRVSPEGRFSSVQPHLPPCTPASRIPAYAVSTARNPVRGVDAGGERGGGEDDTAFLLGLLVSAMDRVSVYVAGGRAISPSSLLMKAIPIVVAGVSHVIMEVPAPINYIISVRISGRSTGWT
jgi:Histidinol dehydrogenase